MKLSKAATQQLLRPRTFTAAARVPVGALPSVGETRRSLPQAVGEKLQDYPSLITLPVQWGEMDAYGHVNNVSYVRYFESGRLAFFDQVVGGRMDQEEYREFIGGKSVGLIVKQLGIRYRHATVYPDTLSIGVRVKTILETSFEVECLMVSHKLEGKVVAEGHCECVTFDYTNGSKTRIPAKVLDALRDSLPSASIRQ